MSRPLRIEYPGAWYHVMNRGRRAECIFEDDANHLGFLDLLKEADGLWNIRISAYCMMPNHYHLLVNTPEGNLFRAMRHINGVYTQRFNRRHRCDGQLFRGRFKSILVEEDSYLLQLVRYIHRNPLLAGLAASTDQYRWSSHAGYFSKGEQWDWLHKRFILSILSSDSRGWRKAYLEFMEMDDEDEILQIFRGGKQPSAVGTEGFVRGLKKRFFEEKIHPQIPESVALAPEIDDIKNAVCAYYRVDESRLSQSRRGWFNEPRAVAIYLARTLRRERLMGIGARFRLRSYSAVSSVLAGMERQLAEDAALRDRLHEVRGKVLKNIKGQTETGPLHDPLSRNPPAPGVPAP